MARRDVSAVRLDARTPRDSGICGPVFGFFLPKSLPSGMVAGVEKKPLPRILFALAFVLVLAVAVWLRVIDLGDKVLHGDEANQAVKFGMLLEDGFYEYDPTEHHGPTLYYLTLPAAWAVGADTLAAFNETALRSVPVVFGLLAILLMALLADGLGRNGAITGALLCAVSPMMVYFSRYYVQEILLICFSLGMIACGWRYIRRPHVGWAIGLGVCVGLIHATKETCILVGFSAAAGLIATWLWERFDKSRSGDEPFMATFLSRETFFPPVSLKHVGIAAGCAAVVSVVFYSSFFSHWQGVPDSLTAYFGSAEKAGAETGHEKPWHYYFHILGFYKQGGYTFSEGPILGLSLAGLVTTIFFGRKFPVEQRRLWRFLAVYTVALTAVYSVIPYKTPWLAMGFMQTMALLGGIGVEGLMRLARWKPVQIVLGLLVLGGAWFLGKHAYRSTHRLAADDRNPYVYSHSAVDILKVGQRVEEIADFHPDGKNLVIKIISEDYWPLPWYLRAYPNTGYWYEVPENADADIVVTSLELDGAVEAALTDDYSPDMVGLRPGVILITYIRRDLWDRFIEERAKNGPKR